MVHQCRGGGSWHFISLQVRFARYYFYGDVAVPRRGSSSILGRTAAVGGAVEQSVGRAARCATFVRGRAPLASLLSRRTSVAGVKEIAHRASETARWQCRNLAHLTVLTPRSKKLRRCAIWRRTNVPARSKP